MSMRPRLIHILAAVTLALGVVLSVAPSVSSQQKGRPRPVSQPARPMQAVRPLPRAQPSSFLRSPINQSASFAAGLNVQTPASFGAVPLNNGFAGQFNGGFGFQGAGPVASGRGFVVASPSNPLLPLPAVPTGTGVGFGSDFGAFPGGFGPGGPVGVSGFPVGFGGNVGLGPVNNFGGFGAFPAVGGLAGKNFGFNGGVGL